MKWKQIPSWALPILYSTLFAVLAWVFLFIRNADTMFFLQDRGWWNSTRLFWQDCTAVPGGLLSWVGAYLTQYFYYPALGCAMYIGLLLLTFWVAKRSLRIPDEWSFLLLIPLAALITTDIQMGYWVYILKDIDYVFYHPLGLFVAVLLSCPFWDLLPGERLRHSVAVAWIPAVAAIAYYPFGIYGLLAAVIVAARLLSRGPFTGLAALCAVLPTLYLVPYLETQGTTLMTPDEPWFYGFHHFALPTLNDTSLELPFYLTLALPVLFPFVGRALEGRRHLPVSQGLMVLTFAAMAWALSSRDFTDPNFHAEMRMQRAVEEHRWTDVLTEAARVKGPVTREMVLLRDIALLNRGELNSRRYTFNNESVPPVVVSDSVHMRISDMAGDLIYYNFGETCFAIRRAIERCMRYGYGYYTQRILAQCAIINGEYDNARRYLRLLSHTTFQRSWAEKVLPYVDRPETIAGSEMFGMPMRLYNNGSELVGTDDSYVEQTLLNKWMYTDTNDPVAQEVALMAAMQLRNQNVFWAQIQRYYALNPGRPFPTHAQEAMLFYFYELKSKGVNLAVVQFDERVKQRYQNFFTRLNQFSSQGMNEQQIGAALRPEFGDTYMWDYCVLRQIQTN